MILTGNERFEVRPFRQPPYVKKLADMSVEEVLHVANELPHFDATRKALYPWQAMRRRETRP
jgi:hypothetical protein